MLGTHSRPDTEWVLSKSSLSSESSVSRHHARVLVKMRIQVALSVHVQTCVCVCVCAGVCGLGGQGGDMAPYLGNDLQGENIHSGLGRRQRRPCLQGRGVPRSQRKQLPPPRALILSPQLSSPHTCPPGHSSILLQVPQNNPLTQQHPRAVSIH